MIFLLHPDKRFAAVEDASHAPAYESRGYVRCSYAAFRAAWVERDRKVLAQIAPASPAPDADPPPLPSFVPSEALEAAGQNYTLATPWPYFGTVSEAILLAQ